MQNNVERVVEVLRAEGATGEVRMLEDSAPTAATAAAGLGVEVAQIANSLVFVADGEPLLVIASGGRRVDTTLLAQHLGVAKIRRADPELVRSHTGFAIGGVAPVGHRNPIRTVVDNSLAEWDEVWAAAGHPHSVFPTSYDELLRITGGEAHDVRAEQAPTT
ncbi:MAG: YbaK/EbsC family protein [Streptosporangiales bacterium]|nr:YbaK/EbsC family protein [Streptosporangiales bacterium]